MSVTILAGAFFVRSVLHSAMPAVAVIRHGHLVVHVHDIGALPWIISSLDPYRVDRGVSVNNMFAECVDRIIEAASSSLDTAPPRDYRDVGLDILEIKDAEGTRFNVPQRR